jgi:Xaa-Pro aminopeptidase
MRQTKPGKHEFEMVGLMEGLTLSNNCTMAYPIICTINGQTLHNHYYGNRMGNGQLLLIDAGAESPLHYATDITRTIPVSGSFTGKQKDIYNIVLKAESESIKMIKPGIPYQEVHLNAARIISEGLKEVGLMKGNIGDAVENGAHALFFPHGLGHMIGLDVHDMENLGEDHVGYNDKVKRIDQFGTAYLRLGRELQNGFTITVEPGIYFIPVLIEKWKSENIYRDFINYDKLSSYIDFGGVRVEDTVVVNEDGCRVIGKPIPKTIDEIEQVMNNQ